MRERLSALSPATWILAALVLAGLVLRVVAAASWWPTITTLADSWPYASYAERGPFLDPQHPAGYSLLLALVGAGSREVAVPIVLQHLGGIAAALLLYAAVRRLTNSPWPGLLPAGVVLLNADQIFLEHTIMSEAPFVTVLAGTLYATMRAVDEPAPWWRWPALAAALAVLATTIRSAGLFVIPVLVVAIVASQPRPWRPRWRAPVALAGVAGALLLAFALANQLANDRFELGPTQGWHLYGRVASFADCRQFKPPKGTERLCESTPVRERYGNDWYLYDPAAPSVRLFGPRPWEKHDAELGKWARAVIWNQPRAYADAMWNDLLAFFVPSRRIGKLGGGGDLDPQLDWVHTTDGADAIVRDVEQGMETFYDPFTVSTSQGGRRFLHRYQRIFRFGATALTLMTLLTLLGLLIGPGRTRIGVVLFGVGGLALLAAPIATVYYVGRYTVPVAGPVSAGAAIALFALWRLESDRRRGVLRLP